MRLKLVIMNVLATTLLFAFTGTARADMIGIDVSRWQGEVDWPQVSTQVSFAMIKAGGADDGLYNDAQFLRNRDEARRLGIPHGYYYFAGGTDPVAEAEHFVSLISPLQPGEIVALDFEVDHPNPVDFVRLFMIRSEQLLGVKPMLYTYMSKIWAYDWQPVAGNGNRLWGAIYDGEPQAQPPAGAWPALALKQFTDGGNLAGISANTVDLNYYSSSIQDFQALSAVPAPPAPGQPKETYRSSEIASRIGSTFSDISSPDSGDSPNGETSTDSSDGSPVAAAFSGAQGQADTK